MSNAEILISALYAITPVVSVIVAIIVARRNNHKDLKMDAEKNGRIETKVDGIFSSVQEIKEDLREYNRKQDALQERLAKLETAFESHKKDKNIHSINRKKA